MTITTTGTNTFYTRNNRNNKHIIKSDRMFVVTVTAAMRELRLDLNPAVFYKYQ